MAQLVNLALSLQWLGVQSLAWELPSVMGAAKKTKKKQKTKNKKNKPKINEKPQIKYLTINLKKLTTITKKKCNLNLT